MGGPPPQARDRAHRPPGRRRRARHLWRDQRARHRRRRQGREARHRLLPADRELPGEDLRRGQDPRRLFQARGTSDREGDAHLAADRPADQAAVRARLQERDASHRHRALARHGERSGHRGDGRGLGRAHAVRRSVPRTDRRRPRRLYRGQICAEPDDRRDGRELARSRRGRHRRRRADGRIRGQGAVRGSDARRRGVRPEAFPASARRHRQARRARRQGAMGAEAQGRVPRSSRACAPPPKPDLREAYAIAAKHERRDRVAQVKDEGARRCRSCR